VCGSDPIYIMTMESMCRAYAQEGSPESTKRKFGLKCLWYNAGRTCETSFLTVGDLKHDPNFHFTCGECPQWKPGKLKHAAFGVGAIRHICWYTDFGDYLAVGDHQLISAPGEIDWLIPDLQKVKAPGQVLGAWVKDLQKIVPKISEFAKWREEHGEDLKSPSQPSAKRPRVETDHVITM
jgi:hypothetical protein